MKRASSLLMRLVMRSNRATSWGKGTAESDDGEVPKANHLSCPRGGGEERKLAIPAFESSQGLTWFLTKVSCVV
jgi:hypothetical protein